MQYHRHKGMAGGCHGNRVASFLLVWKLPEIQQISYRRHRFPATIIQHAVWLYFRITLSYRDVEDLLAERGIEVSYNGTRWTHWVNSLHVRFRG